MFVAWEARIARLRHLQSVLDRRRQLVEARTRRVEARRQSRNHHLRFLDLLEVHLVVVFARQVEGRVAAHAGAVEARRHKVGILGCVCGCVCWHAGRVGQVREQGA